MNNVFRTVSYEVLHKMIYINFFSPVLLVLLILLTIYVFNYSIYFIIILSCNVYNFYGLFHSLYNVTEIDSFNLLTLEQIRSFLAQ